MTKPKPRPRPAALLDRDAKPPAWLDADAKREWRRIVPDLVNEGVPLAALDVGMLCTYCDAYATFRRCVEALADGMTFTTSHGGTQPRPENALKARAVAAILAVERRLGLSPASRARLSTSPQVPEEEDPMEALLREAGTVPGIDELLGRGGRA